MQGRYLDPRRRVNLGSSLRWNDADLGVWWGIRRHLPTAAPVILTSSDRFAATSSIKEEEGDYPCRIACLLLFLDGRGAPDVVRGGAGDSLVISVRN